MSRRPMLRAQVAVSTFAVALATLFSTPATAQDTTPAEGASDAGPAIIVTGSRIRRPADFDTPSPIVSLSAEAVQESGTTKSDRLPVRLSRPGELFDFRR